MGLLIISAMSTMLHWIPVDLGNTLFVWQLGQTLASIVNTEVKNAEFIDY